MIECAGLGAVSDDGAVKNSVQVKIGDGNAEVRSATLTNRTAGVYRVTIVVPSDTPVSDTTPLVVSVGDKTSSPVTIPVGVR